MAAGIAVAALHAQARVEMVLSTVRRLLAGAAARPVADAASGEAGRSRSPTCTASLSGWPR